VLLMPVYISDVHDVHEFIDKSSAEPRWVLHECCVTLRWGQIKLFIHFSRVVSDSRS
jgi:hypothetical protein